MALTLDHEHHNDHRAEQLSLVSLEELETMRIPSLYRPSTAARMPSSHADGGRKARRPEGSAIQPRLPGFDNAGQ